MQAWEPEEDPLPDVFMHGVLPVVTPPLASSCQVKSLHLGIQPLLTPCPSLTCNCCLQVVAEALAKADVLHGPELAAKFRSQLRNPLAASLQVISYARILLIIQNPWSLLSRHISHCFLYRRMRRVRLHSPNPGGGWQGPVSGWPLRYSHMHL